MRNRSRSFVPPAQSVQNLRGFFVVVEAPGYKPGRANANSANILKQLLAP